MNQFITSIINFSLRYKYLVLCLTIIFIILELWNPAECINAVHTKNNLITLSAIVILHSVILILAFQKNIKTNMFLEQAIEKGILSSILILVMTTLIITLLSLLFTNIYSLLPIQLTFRIIADIITISLSAFCIIPSIYSIVCNLTKRRKNRKRLEKIGS